VEDDVSADPGDVGVLGAATIVAGAEGRADTVEQARPRSGAGRRLADGQRTGLAPLYGVANRPGRLRKLRRRRPLSFSIRL